MDSSMVYLVTVGKYNKIVCVTNMKVYPSLVLGESWRSHKEINKNERFFGFVCLGKSLICMNEFENILLCLALLFCKGHIVIQI